MKKLNVSQLQDRDRLVFPEEFTELTLGSPALCFVTDFKSHHPALVTPSVSAMQAAQMMDAGRLNALLVLDRDGAFAGLLTAEDLSYQKVMQWVAAGVPRHELTVGDFMRPRSELKILSYPQVEKSSIRDVLETMRQHGQRHCLLVDQHNHHVRGLISVAEVGRRLQVEIDIDRVPTFAEIQRAVARAH
ncbi:CBS domain-containing protein [Microbulbifer thermotolerans]|uniref:CBS domain-containing protein n=1 Tax=Microbulbifer thermotolerans TaxID=252514 RepID=UPI00224A5E38|nr:CBS domain-containing protein [Microbulbifer thermotolerans]MCX2841354.1 CBS domain-containing protein [Microbulbifer thermotolerans]